MQNCFKRESWLLIEPRAKKAKLAPGGRDGIFSLPWPSQQYEPIICVTELVCGRWQITLSSAGVMWPCDAAV